MGATFTLTPPRHALFKVLSVTPLSAHSHGFLPYSDLDPHLHIIVEIEIWTGKCWMKTLAMIDSGCSANVIDSRFAAALNIHPIIKSRAIKYTMADGETSAGGTVTHDITTKIKIGPHQEVLTLDITKLHSYPIMLGIPWLKRHDPWIQWSQHRITFNSPFCLTHCHLNDAYTATALSEYPTFSPPVTPLPVTPPSVTPPSVTPSLVTTSPASSTTTFKSILKLPHSRTPRKKQKARKVSWSPNIPTTTPPPATLPPPAPSTKRAPKVSLINAVAFHHCLKMPDIQLYRFHISEITSTPAEEGDPDLTKIPPEYHEFAKVFSKEESDKLPEHCPYDHTIPLQDGTAPPFGPIYNLSPAELEYLRKYIDENLSKNFLRTHSHQRRLLSSLSRNLMDHYVYVLIIVALTESQSRIATLSLLSASCLAAWAKQNTSPNSICEMDTIAFGSPEGKNGKQPSAVDMDFMNIKLCLLAFAMLLAHFNTSSTTPSENILTISWLPISTTRLPTRVGIVPSRLSSGVLGRTGR